MRDREERERGGERSRERVRDRETETNRQTDRDRERGGGVGGRACEKTSTRLTRKKVSYRHQIPSVLTESVGIILHRLIPLL